MTTVLFMYIFKGNIRQISSYTWLFAKKYRLICCPTIRSIANLGTISKLIDAKKDEQCSSGGEGVRIIKVLCSSYKSFLASKVRTTLKNPETCKKPKNH